MVEFSLPKNSKPRKGKVYGDPNLRDSREFRIYRWSEGDEQPRIDTYFLKKEREGTMLLDSLIRIREDFDSTLSFRRSCREGVCGSCSMNINGKNGLACISALPEGNDRVDVYPLPHMTVVKDLITDLSHAYKQLASVEPWLKSDTMIDRTRERLQSKEDRAKLDGLYECVLCFCCSTSCPSYWWNSDRYLGPATLLQIYRWVVDSRDTAKAQRVAAIDDAFKLFRCHTIMNCVQVCPKGLNPAKAISSLKELTLTQEEES